MDDVVPCRQGVHFGHRRSQPVIVPLMPANYLPAPGHFRRVPCHPPPSIPPPPVAKSPPTQYFPFGRPKVPSPPPFSRQKARQLLDHELVHSLLDCQHDDSLFAACELRDRGWYYNRALRCWYRPTGRAPVERLPSHDVVDVSYYEANHLGQLTGLKVVVNFRWVHAHFH